MSLTLRFLKMAICKSSFYFRGTTGWYSKDQEILKLVKIISIYINYYVYKCSMILKLYVKTLLRYQCTPKTGYPWSKYILFLINTLSKQMCEMWSWMINLRKITSRHFVENINELNKYLAIFLGPRQIIKLEIQNWMKNYWPE